MPAVFDSDTDVVTNLVQGIKCCGVFVADVDVLLLLSQGDV